MDYLPRLTSNRGPPDLCLLSSKDYRRELLAPGNDPSTVLIDCENVFYLLEVCSEIDSLS
jgi:hypothetical protein